MHNCKQNLNTSISRILFEIWWKMLNFLFVHTAQVMQMMPNTFLAHYRQFQLVCYQSYTRSRCCFTPNRWGCHFRSRDKDGGHTIRFAVAENPLLYANFTALSSTEPELLPIEFFWHCGNRDFRVFLRKIRENIIFPICVAKLMQMMPKHICWPVIDFSSLCAAGVIRIQGVVFRRIG